MRLLGRRADDRVLRLLEESGANAHRATAMLRDMIAGFPERPQLARDVLLCEQEGDRSAHDIIHRLNEPGRRPPTTRATCTRS